MTEDASAVPHDLPDSPISDHGLVSDLKVIAREQIASVVDEVVGTGTMAKEGLSPKVVLALCQHFKVEAISVDAATYHSERTK